MTLASCGGGSGGSGGSSGTPTPTPPAVVNAITVDGTVRTPTAIDTLTTRSGHWKFSDLGAVGTDSHAYLWKLDEKAEFTRVMICRRAFTIEAGDNDQLSLKDVAVKVEQNGTTSNWAFKIAQGSCRVMQNMEPVAPNVAWLREAVTQGRIPSYRRERGRLPTLTALSNDTRRGAYDPSSLGPVPGSSDAPNQGGNYVGTTSSQGGEYESSRSFIHNADARVVDAALHNEDAAITAYMPEFVQYTFYSLAQPQGAVWSTTNKITADPQFPFTGDKAYEIARAPRSPRTDIDSLIQPVGWDRDDAHLENTAFVHWILTEDPLAGMVVQRQAAFALGNYFEYKRTEPFAAYAPNIEQERASYNALSTLWKSRDVSKRVSSTNGTVIWSEARAEKMATETIASLATLASQQPFRSTAAVTGAVIAPIAVRTWQKTDGGTIDYIYESNFEGFQYGKEPLWLWTKAGNATTAGWLKAKARQAVVRALYIGGAFGVDAAADIRGSSLPLGPVPATETSPSPFATDREWATWFLAQPIVRAPTDRYDGAAIHTVIQMYALLQFAKDAKLDVPELDAAISRMDADAARTTAFRFPDLLMHKHTAGPGS